MTRFTPWSVKDPAVGKRVELHPGCDMWMRGAKYGTIVAVNRTHRTVRLYLDMAPSKVLAFPIDRVRAIGEEYGAL